MSTLCHCPYFRESVAEVYASREFTKIEGAPVVTYNGTNHYIRNMHLIGFALCHDVVSKVVSKVQNGLSSSDSSQTSLSVDLLTISEQVCANWCNARSINSFRIELQRDLKMDQEGFQSTVEKLSQIVKIFFAAQIHKQPEESVLAASALSEIFRPELEPCPRAQLFAEDEKPGEPSCPIPDSSGCLCIPLVFHADELPNQLTIWRGEMLMKSTNYLFEQLGFTNMGEAVFSEEQKQRFGVSSSKTETSPKKLSCFAYALLQVGELQAKSLIFLDRGGNQANKAILAARKTLSSWDWRVVEMPNEGDLVLYYSLEDETCTHVGVYTEDGKVLSKLGIENPIIYKHGLFDMSGLHFQEDRVFFMRKSSNEQFRK